MGHGRDERPPALAQGQRPAEHQATATAARARHAQAIQSESRTGDHCGSGSSGDRARHEPHRYRGQHPGRRQAARRAGTGSRLAFGTRSVTLATRSRRMTSQSSQHPWRNIPSSTRTRRASTSAGRSRPPGAAPGVRSIAPMTAVPRQTCCILGELRALAIASCIRSSFLISTPARMPAMRVGCRP